MKIFTVYGIDAVGDDANDVTAKFYGVYSTREKAKARMIDMYSSGICGIVESELDEDIYNETDWMEI